MSRPSSFHDRTEEHRIRDIFLHYYNRFGGSPRRRQHNVYTPYAGIHPFLSPLRNSVTLARLRQTTPVVISCSGTASCVQLLLFTLHKTNTCCRASRVRARFTELGFRTHRIPIYLYNKNTMRIL